METNSIYFHVEKPSFSLDKEQQLRGWILGVIASRGFDCGTLNFIFTSDEQLLEINKEHLDHDYFTDIITFDYREEKTLNGDIFISVDRVQENASNLSIFFEDELHRVLIHGVLHIIGFHDKTDEEAKIMRAQEDISLNLRGF